MSLGLTPVQADMFVSTTDFCAGRVAADSIYGLLLILVLPGPLTPG